jgi:hypothetical protein
LQVVVLVLPFGQVAVVVEVFAQMLPVKHLAVVHQQRLLFP